MVLEFGSSRLSYQQSWVSWGLPPSFVNSKPSFSSLLPMSLVVFPLCGHQLYWVRAPQVTSSQLISFSRSYLQAQSRSEVLGVRTAFGSDEGGGHNRTLTATAEWPGCQEGGQVDRWGTPREQEASSSPLGSLAPHLVSFPPWPLAAFSFAAFASLTSLVCLAIYLGLPGRGSWWPWNSN